MLDQSEKTIGWTYYHYRWAERMRQFGLDPAHLTTKVEVAPVFRDLATVPAGAWWEKKSIDSHSALLNLILYKRLNYRTGEDLYRFARHWDLKTYLHPMNLLEGTEATAGVLAATDGDSEANCAILTLASLHPRYFSHRRECPNRLLDRDSRFSLTQACRTVLEKINIHTPWIGWHTETFPHLTDDHDYELKSSYAIPRYFAEEHAANLCCYAAIAFDVVEDLSPEMVNSLSQIDPSFPTIKAQVERIAAERAEAEAQERREYEIRLDEAAARHEQQQAELRMAASAARAEHLATINAQLAEAGYDPIEAVSAWSEISDEELQRLLWTMPVIYIARIFNVSDVAIHKAAKSRNIKKPPQGFWNKVTAGKIAHPKGVPIKA